MGTSAEKCAASNAKNTFNENKVRLVNDENEIFLPVVYDISRVEFLEERKKIEAMIIRNIIYLMVNRFHRIQWVK